MNSQILTKINTFLNKRVIEVFGFSIVLLGLFLFISIISYSPEDPNFIYTPGDIEIKNIGGFYGSVLSDFFLQSIGLVSFLFLINLFYWGLKLIYEKKIFNFIAKIFFTITYIISGTTFINIFYNESFWLIDNGNGGFVGRIIKERIYNFTQLIEHEYSIYFLILFTAIFFILSLSLKINEILKILSSPLIFFKKTINLFKKNKKNNNTADIDVNSKDVEEDVAKTKQPILPFTIRKEKKSLGSAFKLPPIDFLKKKTDTIIKTKINEAELNKKSQFLEKILLDFGVEGKIKAISYGPVVTLNEFEPAAGIKVSKIINLAEDIARNTSSESARISTIPGSSTVGIELPNLSRENVHLSEIISSSNFLKKDIKLPIALGKSISGDPIVRDLSAMPHLLIAGTTGSGKSVCINTIILSLLYKHTPEKCKFILIDPKMLELSTYEGVPHLLCPVITEAKKAASVLGWVVKEMENRYRLMTKVGVRNIDSYNTKHKLAMPFIVVIVDEMSDLMLVHGKEIEGYIQKLSQMARAAGIHIIMATQRPSVDVITGTIKANFPTRISFQVSSKIDSRTILGEQGAEQLLGKGDMLYMSSANKIIRIHAPFVSENEIEKINSFLRSQAEPNYVDEILNFVDEKEIKFSSDDNENQDELYTTALELIKTEGKASTSFLQRKLQIGYNRAARIIDMMEENKEVSKPNHVGKREILK